MSNVCTDGNVGRSCNPIRGHHIDCRYYQDPIGFAEDVIAKAKDSSDLDDRHTVLVADQAPRGLSNGRHQMGYERDGTTASETDAKVDGKKGASQIYAFDERWYCTPAVASVLEERANQDEMWGEQDHSPHKWLAILMEEVGEFAQEINEPPNIVRGVLIRDECVQVAAVALAMVECLDRGKWDAQDNNS